jgi:hypothetical protein
MDRAMRCSLLTLRREERLQIQGKRKETQQNAEGSGYRRIQKDCNNPASSGHILMHMYGKCDKPAIIQNYRYTT